MANKLTFEEKQAKRGYILAFRLAHEMGKHHSTIYRWIKDGKIEAEQVGDHQWVKLTSVRDHLGETAFSTLNLDKLLERMKAGQAA